MIRKRYLSMFALCLLLLGAAPLSANDSDQVTALQLNEVGMEYYDAKNYVKAYEAFVKAADKGSTSAMLNLGAMYVGGFGVEKDLSKAFAYIKKAADAGNATAALNVACAYLSGGGVKKNSEEALKWFRTASEKGQTQANYYLGQIYYDGLCGEPKDLKKAAIYYAAGADKNNLDCMESLGYLYFMGEGIGSLPDYKQALKWFLKAGYAGHPSAQNKVGFLLYSGIGTEANHSEAFKWYQKAANQGYAIAEFNLADLYFSGEGVERNYAKAFEFTERAAKQNYSKAYAMLAMLYRFGYGVQKDELKANEYEKLYLEKKAKVAALRGNDFSNKLPKDALSAPVPAPVPAPAAN